MTYSANLCHKYP